LDEDDQIASVAKIDEIVVETDIVDIPLDATTIEDLTNLLINPEGDIEGNDNTEGNDNSDGEENTEDDENPSEEPTE
jgi:hypothetical protein